LVLVHMMASMEWDSLALVHMKVLMEQNNLELIRNWSLAEFQK
jgi:hypothetical protein